MPSRKRPTPHASPNRERTRQVLLRLTDAELDRIDKLRGDVPRERWIRRVLAQAGR